MQERLLWAWRVAVLACLVWIGWEARGIANDGIYVVGAAAPRHQLRSIGAPPLPRVEDARTD